jgi:hypothetical protein
MQSQNCITYRTLSGTSFFKNCLKCTQIPASCNSGVPEHSSLLRRDTVSSGEQFPMFQRIAVPPSSRSCVLLDCCLTLNIEAVRSFRSPGTTQRHISEGFELRHHFPQKTRKFSHTIWCAIAVHLKITTSVSPGFILILLFLCTLFLINTPNTSWVSKVQTLSVFFVHLSVLHVLPNPHQFL